MPFSVEIFDISDNPIAISLRREVYPNAAKNLDSKRFRLGQEGAFGHFQG
jgi:hypothetical protein